MPVKRILSVSLVVVFLFISFVFIADNIVENFLIHKSHIRRIFHFYLTDKENDLILLIGSSQTREDLDARLIQSTLKNYPVYNIGYSGDTPARRLLDLPYILRLKPKAVVIGTDYYQISGNYKLSVEDFKVTADFAREDQEKIYRLFYDNAINDVLHWNRIQVWGYRAKYLAPAMGYLVNGAAPSKKETFYDLKQPFSYTGTLDRESKMKQLYSVFDSRYTVSDRKNEEKLAFAYLLSSLRKNGIKVIVVDMPNNKALNDKVTASSKKNYEEYIDSEVKKRCDLYLSYKSDFDDSRFYDMTHMNKIGRDELSKKIAENLITVLR